MIETDISSYDRERFLRILRNVYADEFNLHLGFTADVINTKALARMVEGAQLTYFSASIRVTPAGMKLLEDTRKTLATAKILPAAWVASVCERFQFVHKSSPRGNKRPPTVENFWAVEGARFEGACRNARWVSKRLRPKPWLGPMPDTLRVTDEELAKQVSAVLRRHANRLARLESGEWLYEVLDG